MPIPWDLPQQIPNPGQKLGCKKVSVQILGDAGGGGGGGGGGRWLWQNLIAALPNLLTVSQ